MDAHITGTTPTSSDQTSITLGVPLIAVILGAAFLPTMRLIVWPLSAALVSLITSAPASAAWMVLVVGYTNPTTIKKDFSTMESCEAAAEHILRVRTPKDPTTGVPGAWKYNYNIGSGSEPAMSMLCVPSDEEMRAVQEGLTQKEWFRDLSE